MIQLNGWQKQNLLRFFVAFLAGISFMLLVGELHQISSSSQQRTDSAIAQFIDPEEIAPFVYERLPDFPQENHYTNIETGAVDADDTLAERLIRYHLYVKSRPPQYRLDWKITMADYLGVHSPMRATQYPGEGRLTPNPMNNDIAIIRSFNRQQRNELVNVLAGIFNPNKGDRPSSPTPPTPPTQPQPQETTPRRPVLPPPGAADLLKF